MDITKAVKIITRITVSKQPKKTRGHKIRAFVYRMHLKYSLNKDNNKPINQKNRHLLLKYNIPHYACCVIKEKQPRAARKDYRL